MSKLTVTYKEGWPIMLPMGKKELDLVKRNLVAGEALLGSVIGNFNQVVVASAHKVLVVKTGIMAGQTFGSKATSFDYRNIGGVEIRSGFAQGEFEIINPMMPARQGNRNRDKVKINESPNGVVFPSGNVKHFEAMAAKIRERVGILLTPQSAPVAAQVAEPPPDIPAQIQKLAELHAGGILTDEEFSSKKAELLARM